MNKLLVHNKEEWEIIKEIGRGQFGVVFKAKKISNFFLDYKGLEIKDDMAIKVIPQGERFNENEVKSLDELTGHDNICKYYGCGKDDKNYYIYTEFVNGISINVKRNEYPLKRFPEQQIFYIASLLIRGLTYVHGKGIIHRDLKSDNILLVQHEYYTQLKFIDFGFSIKLKKDEDGATLASTSSVTGDKDGLIIIETAGTNIYMSPEQKQMGRQGKDFGSDIWSIGCILVEMAGGNLTERDKDNVPVIPDYLSSECRNFISKFLSTSTDGRVDIEPLFHQKFSNNLPKFREYHYEKGMVLPKCIEGSFRDLDLSIYDQEIPVGFIPNTIANLSIESEKLQTISLNSIPYSVICYNLSLVDQIVLNHDKWLSSNITTLELKLFNSSLSVGFLSNKITRLRLPNFNQPIEPDQLPNQLIDLVLPSFNQEIKHSNVFPSTLKALFLHEYNQNLPAGSLSNLNCLVRFFIPKFNSTFAPGSLSNSIIHLLLPEFNKLIEPLSILNSVTTLELPEFNQIISMDSLPKSITKLSLPKFNQPLSLGSIPDCGHIQEGKNNFIKLNSYNHPIGPNYFSIYLSEIALNSFNHPIEIGCFNLIISLRSLELNSYNHPLVSGMFPDNLEFLCLRGFNQPITESNVFPSKCLSNLYLDSFNQPLVLGVQTFPDKLSNLSLNSFNQLLQPNSLPVGLSFLDLNLYDKQLLKDSLPNEIRSVTLLSLNSSSSNDSLPTSITSLNLINHNEQLVSGNIPVNVTSLEMNNYNKPLKVGSIPDNQESHRSLRLPLFNNEIEPNSIPPSIKHLRIPSFNHLLSNGSLPNSIKDIQLPLFNQPLKPNDIPIGVIKLSLPSFNQPLVINSIPNTVTTLDLTNFNQEIDSNQIPNSITNLTFGEYFNVPEYACYLPNDTIKIFKSDYKFKDCLQQYLPPSITELHLNNYNLPITKGCLYENVKSLTLGNEFGNIDNINSLKYLPNSIISISFNCTTILNCDTKLIKSIKPTISLYKPKD